MKAKKRFLVYCLGMTGRYYLAVVKRNGDFVWTKNKGRAREFSRTQAESYACQSAGGFTNPKVRVTQA
jgi:hypothetical protein